MIERLRDYKREGRRIEKQCGIRRGRGEERGGGERGGGEMEGGGGQI
jgi:hypothetical protein